MIIGHGDIAGAIPAELDRPDWVWFASGVSNSGETRKSEYDREDALMWDLWPNRRRHVVYFSSLAVFYSSTRYTRHKRSMEELVKELFPSYTIVYLGNILWGKNPHTLINFMRARHAAGLPLEIRDTKRCVHTLAEFTTCLRGIDTFSRQEIVGGRWLTVREIVNEFVYQKVPA